VNITAVRVHLENRGALRAYCELEFDGEFVAKQVKIIEKDGRLIVGMPSKKRTTPCVDPYCDMPCPITDEFCSVCGVSQGPQGPRIDQMRRHFHMDPTEFVSFYSDLFHPINPECRAKLERAVLEAYRRKLEETDARET